MDVHIQDIHTYIQVAARNIYATIYMYADIHTYIICMYVNIHTCIYTQMAARNLPGAKLPGQNQIGAKLFEAVSSNIINEEYIGRTSSA
jgi:hypothetical protein